MKKHTNNTAMAVPLQRLVRRFWGRSYPVRDIKETQAHHGRLGPHVEVEWTTPEHWAHNNYERTHLPQLCIRASGWKARLIALVLMPKTPWEPYQPNAKGLATQEGANSTRTD